MEVVSGKCIICDECSYVLSETNKKVYLDLFKRIKIVNVQYYTQFSQLFSLQSLCVICAYGLKSCAANLETIKKKAKVTKKRSLSDKSCSLCFDTDNVILCIASIKEETVTYLNSIKVDIKVDVQRLCLSCFHCVTVRNNLSKRVHNLMTSEDATDLDTDSRDSNKKSSSGKNKSDKRKRESRATRKDSITESPTSEDGDSVRKRPRLSKRTRILSKKNEKNRKRTSEDLDNMLEHLETVDAKMNATNIHLNWKVRADKRMMFDISYVNCETIEAILKQKSNSDTNASTILISDDEINMNFNETSRTSKRIKKRPNYALISKPKYKTVNKSSIKCGICGECFSTSNKLNLHKVVHDSSKVNGKSTRIKAAKKEMQKDTDTEKENSETENEKSENSVSEYEESPKKAKSARSQRKAKVFKKEYESDQSVNTNEGSSRNTRSLKRKVRNKVSKAKNEKDDSRTEHEENSESENDKIEILKRKTRSPKKQSKRVTQNKSDTSGSENEKESEHSEIEDNNAEKSKKNIKGDISVDILESENEIKFEHSETEDSDNIEKSKEKSCSPKQKNKSNVSTNKTVDNDEEKSEHSEIEDHDNTELSKRKACLQEEKRKSDKSNDKADEDKSEQSEIEDDITEKSKRKARLQKEKRASKESQVKSDEDKTDHSETEDVDTEKRKREIRSSEKDSVNKTKKGNVSDINSTTRSPKGKRDNNKDKETCNDTSESEHENNSTNKQNSSKIKKTRIDETSDEHLEKENLTKENSKLPEGENNNENVDKSDENEKSKEELEKEIEDEDNKSTDDNQVESSETNENSSKKKKTLAKEQNTEDSKKEKEETDKDAEHEDTAQNNEDLIEEKSDELLAKSLSNEIEKDSVNNEEENMNEELFETNDKENEIEEQSPSKEHVDTDCIVVDDENDSLDNVTKSVNDDAASDTTEILSDDFNNSQKIANEEETPAGKSVIEVDDENSEVDSLKLSSASTNDTENEKSGNTEDTFNKGKSTGKNNPSDFNYVEKLLENLGA